MKLADKDKAVKEENMNKMESGIMENRIGKVNIIEGGVTAAPKAAPLLHSGSPSRSEPLPEQEN